MNNEKQKILDMIDQGTITAADGARLLECLGETQEKESEMAHATARRMKGKKLRILVTGESEGNRMNVDVKVPLVLARYADNILQNVMPENAENGLKAQGIDLKGLNLNELVDIFEELDEDILDATILQEEEATDLRVRIGVE